MVHSWLKASQNHFFSHGDKELMQHCKKCIKLGLHVIYFSNCITFFKMLNIFAYRRYNLKQQYTTKEKNNLQTNV